MLPNFCKTSHKKVFRMKTSACRDGTLKNQPNKIGTTYLHYPYYALCLLVVCIAGLWKAIAGCVVHVDVHEECDSVYVVNGYVLLIHVHCLHLGHPSRGVPQLKA